MTSLTFSDHSETVLITGATGFIGQLLVKALLADGKKIIVLTRNLAKAEQIFKGQARCVQAMSDVPVELKIDVIVNLAGARILGWRWSAARKLLLRKSRIGLTQTLVDWIARAAHKPRLLISTSAIGYYGIQAKGDDTTLNEGSAPQSIFMSTLCQDWERVANQARDHGTQVALMRLGLVLGKQGALSMMLLPIKLGLGGPLGDGQQWLSWIHVSDVLRGIAHLWQLPQLPLKDEHGATINTVFNFTSPNAVRQKEFSQIAAQLYHRPCVMPTPAFAMRLILGEQADLLLEGQRVAPDQLHSTGFRFEFSDLKKALEDLR